MQSSLDYSLLQRFRLCNLHQIESFDPLEHVAPWSAPSWGAWIKTWILREVSTNVILHGLDSEDGP